MCDGCSHAPPNTNFVYKMYMKFPNFVYTLYTKLLFGRVALTQQGPLDEGALLFARGVWVVVLALG